MAAQRVLELEPTHSPAWLLYAYARYKRGHRAEAMQILEGLASDPGVGSRARKALRLNHHRHDRDQVHVSFGLDGGLGAAPVVMVDLPLTRHWGVRSEGRYISNWLNRDLSGLMGGLGLTWNTVAGVWRFQLHATVSGLPERGSLMRVGAVGGIRADVRLVQGFGVGAELGTGVIGTEFDPSGYLYGRAFVTVFFPGAKHGLRRSDGLR